MDGRVYISEVFFSIIYCFLVGFEKIGDGF